MNTVRRDRIAIWVLAALCLLLGILLVVTLVSSNAVHPRREAGRPGGHATSDPTSSPSATATPVPTASATPGQGGGSSGGGGGIGGGTGSGGGSINQPSPAYTIAGSLPQQLHPGDEYPLDLTLTNLGNAAMTVVGLHVAISHVTAPNATPSRPCTVNDFAATQVANGFSVALGSFESTSLSARGVPSSQWPQISMLNTAANQDGCKGATLTLSFSGSST
jgi:hypothetical protein